MEHVLLSEVNLSSAITPTASDFSEFNAVLWGVDVKSVHASLSYRHLVVKMLCYVTFKEPAVNMPGLRVQQGDGGL